MSLEQDPSLAYDPYPFAFAYAPPRIRIPPVVAYQPGKSAEESLQARSDSETTSSEEHSHSQPFLNNLFSNPSPHSV